MICSFTFQSDTMSHGFQCLCYRSIIILSLCFIGQTSMLWQPPKYGQASPKQQQKTSWQQSPQTSGDSSTTGSQQQPGKLHVSPQLLAQEMNKDKSSSPQLQSSKSAVNQSQAPKSVSILQPEYRLVMFYYVSQYLKIIVFILCNYFFKFT